jgi:uncharacterized protein (DUF433 family)
VFSHRSICDKEAESLSSFFEPAFDRCYLTVVIDWSHCADIESLPDKLSGAWFFKHTRLPVSALFENLAAGATVHEFVEGFPGVVERQVFAVLRFATADFLR